MNTKEEILLSYGYAVAVRDPKVNAEFVGQIMLTDVEDEGSYAIVGDDRDELVNEAYAWLDLEDPEEPS